MYIVLTTVKDINKACEDNRYGRGGNVYCKIEGEDTPFRISAAKILTGVLKVKRVTSQGRQVWFIPTEVYQV